MANHSLAFCAQPPRLAPRSSSESPTRPHQARTLRAQKYGLAVSWLGPSAAFGSGARSGMEAKASEKSEFDLKLEKYDAAVKIKIIKEVRTFMDLGLKEAKELVEKVPVVNEK